MAIAPAIFGPNFEGSIMVKDDLINKLVIIAINGIAAGSYRDAELAKQFCKLDLSDLADFWPTLTNPTKLMIIEAHQEEFLKWAKSND